MTSGALSKEFIELVKGIGEAKSKAEEDRIVLGDLALLKARMAARNVSVRRMREYLLRLIYVEMLGHDASFAHIHAVKMTHGTRMAAKRVGYLAVSLCLHPHHELMLLLVNTLQHDLQSSNHLDVAMALIVVTQLVSKDLMLALIPLVVKALDHAHPSVRKKAIVALHRCHQINADAVSSYMPKVHRILCDKDPSVMGASLPFFLQLATENAAAIKELVPSFVSILKQIIEHRLPRDYDYRRMPAPWIQVNLLKILAKLGDGDRVSSERAYEVLREVLRRADTGINIGYALIYECVRTIATIYPNNALLEDAAKCISRFISSDYHNRKYLGIDALASIVQVNPQYAAEHQLVVIDCLDDPDETLRRKTLDLLFRMTNPQNVEIIVENMLRFLGTSTDAFLRRDLVSRITQLAERYSPDNSWYIETLNSVFELGGELVRPEVAHGVMRLIAEGSEDPSSNNIQQYAVDTYVRVLSLKDKAQPPDIMLHVIAWVLGEFGHRSRVASPLDITSQLCTLLHGHFENETTRCWILSAIMKLTAHLPSIPQIVYQCIDHCQRSVNVELQQLAHEFFELCSAPATMSKVLPRNRFVERVSVDALLPFLDDYVHEAHANGARPYRPPHDDHEHQLNAALNFQPYSEPSVEPGAAAAAAASLVGSAAASGTAATTTRSGASPTRVSVGDSSLKLAGVQRRWGPSGYNTGDALPQPPLRSAQSTPTSPAARPAASTHAAAAPWDTSATAAAATAAAAHKAAPAEAEVLPAELSEKQKRAAMLFSGLSGDSLAAPKPTASRSTSQPSQSMRRSPSPLTRSGAATGDSGQRSGGSDGDDLLDLCAVFSGSSVDQAPASSTPGASADSLLHFPSLDNDIASHNASHLAQRGSSVKEASPDKQDPFDSILKLGIGLQANRTDDDGPVPASSKTLGSCLDLVPADLRARLEVLSRSEESSLRADAFLRLHTMTVYPPNQPIVIIFVHNTCSSTLRDVLLSFNTHSELTMCFDCEPRANIQSTSVSLPVLNPNQAATVMVSLQPLTPVVAFTPPQLLGKCSYVDSDSNRAHELSFGINVNVKDFMRPAVMQTAEFGACWQQSTFAKGEHKWKSPTSVSSAEEILHRLKCCNMHGVQAIGQETIAAARVLHGGSVSRVLVHIRLGNGIVDSIVRSPDSRYSSAVSLQLQLALQ